VCESDSASLVQIDTKLVCFRECNRCFSGDEQILDVLSPCHLLHWAKIRMTVSPPLNVEGLVRLDSTGTGELDTVTILPLLEKLTAVNNKGDRRPFWDLGEIAGVKTSHVADAEYENPSI
jgi:hypothetical protein